MRRQKRHQKQKKTTKSKKNKRILLKTTKLNHLTLEMPDKKMKKEPKLMTMKIRKKKRKTPRE